MEGDATATVACGAQIAYSFENAGLLHCRTAALLLHNERDVKT